MKTVTFICLFVVLCAIIGVTMLSTYVKESSKQEEPQKLIQFALKETPVILPIPVVKKVIAPTILKVKKTLHFSSRKPVNIGPTSITVKLNKTAANLVRKGGIVKVFIGYCSYEGNQVDANGNVIIPIDWSPPNPSGQIGVAVYSPAAGGNVCSVLI
jgi:hypothetical protein